ncbi:hypothetical protein Fcan01_15696 [Folsomia candida]|uniref:Uncharacterized protein n=1 Tax=Folsomia candida TaxID=158441 RepID=A0A226DWQ6_FOLCA|nr:hypothetical protein Fcan01_15696 [Folsomia candida]
MFSTSYPRPMALMQEEIAALNTALDNAAKQATDDLQPEIDQLIASLDTVSANLFSLKLAVADVESALEESQIVDIVSDILSGPDAGTVFHYEHGVFKRGNASTVISNIVTLGYPEILKNKLWGYQTLYYAVVANGQLYKAPHQFILAHKISMLHRTTPSGDVAAQAKSFLDNVVHPVISRVVFQTTQPPLCVWAVGVIQLDCANGIFDLTEGVSFPYDFEGMDSRSLEFGWAVASIPKQPGFANGGMAYLLRRGNTLISRLGFSKQPTIDWNDQNVDVMDFTSKCEVHDKCEQPLPTDEGMTYLVFGGKLTCPSPISVQKLSTLYNQTI